MKNRECAFCGGSLSPHPYWEYQGLYLCADCIETVVPLVNWPVDEPAKVGGIRLLDLLDPVCTFCHAGSRSGRLIASTNPQGQQTRICGSCVQRAQQVVPSWVYADPFPGWPPWKLLLAANPSVQSRLQIASAEVIRDPTWQQIWQQYLMKVEDSDSGAFVDRNELYWNNHEEVGKTYSLEAFYRELRRLTICIWKHMTTSEDP